VLDGRLRVGLGVADLERLARTNDVAKLNLGNLAAGVAAGAPGSTTVAATVFVAHRCGIRVFATGGIGGVHRGAHESGDVSSDLTALARWPVAVVCAGAKAVLDLPRTVEALETLGVPVLGFRTATFPAFYRRDSGLPIDRRCDTIVQLAAAARAHFALGLGTGIVVANPVPEAHELPADRYEAALARALDEAREKGVRGRAVTPFLLDRLRELSAGDSVSSNLALLESNARVAGALSRTLSERGGAA
jgi:pseudouridine-5'-phosphate glycosidase